jgi:hypothetical protein
VEGCDVGMGKEYRAGEVGQQVPDAPGLEAGVGTSLGFPSPRSVGIITV